LTEVKVPARKGRPPKAAIEAKKHRGAVGRPAGDAARIQEFKARLLGTTGEKVINKIIQIGMEDGHAGQMAALKMMIDRVLPISAFEEAKEKGMTPTVTINVTGLTKPTIELAQDVTDID
jgi:uncharacterized protein (DUF1501 family)